MYYASLKLLLEYYLRTYFRAVIMYYMSLKILLEYYLPTYLHAANVLHEFETIIWSITYLHTCMQLMYYMSLELLYGMLPTYLLACS